MCQANRDKSIFEVLNDEKYIVTYFPSALHDKDDM
jgi:hypothetical protein